MRLLAFTLLFAVLVPCVCLACSPVSLSITKFDKYKHNFEAAPEDVKLLFNEYFVDQEYVLSLGHFSCDYWENEALANPEIKKVQDYNAKIIDNIFEKWKNYE